MPERIPRRITGFSIQLDKLPADLKSEHPQFIEHIDRAFEEMIDEVG